MPDYNILDEFFIWYQGEQDANSEAQANAYSANLAGLDNRFERDCLAYTSFFNFITVRISNLIAPVYVPTVRAAQEQYNFVNVDDLELGDDGLHFVSAAQNTMAERFFAKIKAKIPN